MMSVDHVGLGLLILLGLMGLLLVGVLVLLAAAVVRRLFPRRKRKD